MIVTGAIKTAFLLSEWMTVDYSMTPPIFRWHSGRRRPAEQPTVGSAPAHNNLPTIIRITDRARQTLVALTQLMVGNRRWRLSFDAVVVGHDRRRLPRYILTVIATYADRRVVVHCLNPIPPEAPRIVDHRGGKALVVSV